MPDDQLSYDPTRAERAKSSVEAAQEHGRWMVATWHVDENGQVQLKLEFENWKDADLGTAHMLLRKRLSEILREKAYKPVHDGTQEMGLDPPNNQ